MAVTDVGHWLSGFLQKDSVWYIKRLSANDTLANESHQAGPYFPKELLFELFPRLNDASQRNPDVQLDAYVDSHSDHRHVRAVWYNNRFFGGTRNETRVTNWGGAASALLDPDSTGSIAIFVFPRDHDGETRVLHVWVCKYPAEEDLVESRVAPVEPGHHLVYRTGGLEIAKVQETVVQGYATNCRLAPSQLPSGWLTVFPAAIEIVAKVCSLRPAGDSTVDDRLVFRRNCEFELFQSIEEAIETRNINRQFHSVADFLTHAQRILQRRKARSGKSLELQTRAIFLEEGFVEGRDFSHQPESEAGKRPDFLFPSELAYKSSDFPAARLRMLAAKTTCKDRWRQIINEADRIPTKHLLTLQEGVSANQYAEMREAGVRLVVPTSLITKYPESMRSELIDVDRFIASVRQLSEAH